jgi:DNA mismatch endonuclease, patch repair protein
MRQCQAGDPSREPMADIYSLRKRSELMSRIRGKGNRATELRLIAIFRRFSISGWRRTQRLPGRPDFVFRHRRLAVFVDGCFWHGCVKHRTLPITNRSFWRKKLERNIARDRLVNLTLRRNGWRVLRVWQHELRRKNETRLLKRIERVLSAKATGIDRRRLTKKGSSR